MPHLELNPLDEHVPVPEDEMLWALGHRKEPGQRDADQPGSANHDPEVRTETTERPSFSIPRKGQDRRAAFELTS